MMPLRFQYRIMRNPEYHASEMCKVGDTVGCRAESQCYFDYAIAYHHPLGLDGHRMNMR